MESVEELKCWSAMIFLWKKDCDCNQVSGGRVHPEGKLLKKEYVKASKSQFNDS